MAAAGRQRGLHFLIFALALVRPLSALRVYIDAPCGRPDHGLDPNETLDHVDDAAREGGKKISEVLQQVASGDQRSQTHFHKWLSSPGYFLPELYWTYLSFGSAPLSPTMQAT